MGGWLRMLPYSRQGQTTTAVERERERGLAVATAVCFEIFVIVLFKNKIDF
jgi:hypothetical protein